MWIEIFIYKRTRQKHSNIKNKSGSFPKTFWIDLTQRISFTVLGTREEQRSERARPAEENQCSTTAEATDITNRRRESNGKHENLCWSYFQKCTEFDC